MGMLESYAYESYENAFSTIPVCTLQSYMGMLESYAGILYHSGMLVTATNTTPYTVTHIPTQTHVLSNHTHVFSEHTHVFFDLTYVFSDYTHVFPHHTNVLTAMPVCIL